MSSLLSIALAVARRNVRATYSNPALFVPSLVFPLIFLVAFAAGLSSVGDVPGFDYSAGYTAFQYVFVLLQTASFGGLFTGFAIGADYETGFARRLLLAAPQRLGIVLGLVFAGVIRFLVTAVIVTIAALLAGMTVGGSAPELLALLGLALCLNVAAALFSIGAFYRARTIQAGPAIQTPIFLVLFLAPVYVPLDLLDGWIHAVASWNPATALMESGRGYLAGAPDGGWVALGAVLGLIAVAALFAVTGQRAAERAG